MLKTAKHCAEPAAIRPDKKGVVTLTKQQLALQAMLVCPAEEPRDCPDPAKQERYDATVKQFGFTGSDKPKAQWLKQAYRPECSLEKPAETKPKPEKPSDPSGIAGDKRVGSPS